MPHFRERYAASLVKRKLTYSQIVGMIGHRQVGKTTLSRCFSDEYASMDRQSILMSAQSDPDGFLENRKKPFIVDESQLCPELFPAVKEYVRVHPGPGQFIFSGSVRFTSRKVIRESLTGRIVFQELLPFSIAEAHQEPLPEICLRILKGGRSLPGGLPALHARNKRRFDDYLQSGGLPGICFYREPSIRRDKFEAQLDTVLTRDLQLVYATRLPFRTLRGALSFLALRQGQPLDISQLSRQTRISQPSLRALLLAFEALFLIRVIESKPEKRPVVFFEDQGLASFVAGQAIDRGTNFVRGLFTNILPQFHYRPDLEPKYYQYRTRGGASVPFVIQTKIGSLGIIPFVADAVESLASTIRSAQSFLKHDPRGRVIIAHDSTVAEQAQPNVLILPFTALF